MFAVVISAPVASPSLPNATRVVLGASDDRVSLVVEGAAEDLVRVTIQNVTWRLQ